MKTVKVKIAVAVDPHGNWNAVGWNEAAKNNPNLPMDLAISSVEEGEAHYWITAELPIPAAREIEGNVEEEK